MNNIIEIDNQIAELKTKLENVKGTKCTVYSRVVGYYGATQDWNPGKRQEFEERKTYDI